MRKRNKIIISLLAVSSLVLILMGSCSKKVNTLKDLPTLTTDNVSSINNQSADCGGEIISEGSSPVNDRGVCWGISPNPTTLGTHLSASGSGNSFFVQLTGLASNTVYYARAYAENNEGTGFGNQVTFTTIASKN